jgi:hypothetical protein
LTVELDRAESRKVVCNSAVMFCCSIPW